MLFLAVDTPSTYPVYFITEAVLDGVYPKGSSTSSEPILLKSNYLQLNYNMCVLSFKQQLTAWVFSFTDLTVKPAVRSPGNANKGLHEVMDTFCSRMSKDQERSMEKYGEQLAASDENFMTRFQTTITESVQALLMGMREMHSAHIQPAPPPMAHHYTGFQPPIGPSYGNYSTPGNMAPPQQFMHYATPDNSTRPRAPSNSSPTKEGYQSSKNGKE